MKGAHLEHFQRTGGLLLEKDFYKNMGKVYKAVYKCIFTGGMIHVKQQFLSQPLTTQNLKGSNAFAMLCLQYTSVV